MSLNSKLNTILEGQKTILGAIAAIPAPSPSNFDPAVLEAHLAKIDSEIGVDIETPATPVANDPAAGDPA